MVVLLCEGSCLFSVWIHVPLLGVKCTAWMLKFKWLNWVFWCTYIGIRNDREMIVSVSLLSYREEMIVSVQEIIVSTQEEIASVIVLSQWDMLTVRGEICKWPNLVLEFAFTSQGNDRLSSGNDGLNSGNDYLSHCLIWVGHVDCSRGNFQMTKSYAWDSLYTVWKWSSMIISKEMIISKMCGGNDHSQRNDNSY